MESKKFSKEDTNICKGAAILMMIFHHLFCSVLQYEGQEVVFSPLWEDLVIKISVSCKICVSIFVFLTAYGLSAKKQYTSSESNTNIWYGCLKRHYRLWVDFVCVYIVAFLLACLFDKQSVFGVYGEEKTMPLFVLLDSMGLAKLFGTPSLNETWWYMPLAFLLIYLLPLLIWIYDQVGDVVLFGGILLLPFSGLDKESYFYLYFLAILFGISAERHDILGRLKRRCSDWKRGIGIIAMELLLLVISVYVRYKIPTMTYLMNAVCALEVCALMSCVFAYKLFPRRIFLILGTNSMNMFFVHTFIRKYYLYEWTYSFRHFILIFVALVLASLAISWLLEQVKDRLKVHNRMERIFDFLYNKGVSA